MSPKHFEARISTIFSVDMCSNLLQIYCTCVERCAVVCHCIDMALSVLLHNADMAAAQPRLCFKDDFVYLFTFSNVSKSWNFTAIFLAV